MNKRPDIFDLAFALDENYLVPFYVLLTSIFESNGQKMFKIHVIATGINEVEKAQIAVFVRENKSEIIFYEIDDVHIRKFAVSNESRYTIAVYYRLFFPHIIDKSINRILYLDIDTIVIGDLTELCNLDFGFNPIAVASDSKFYRPDLGIIEKGKYFNSGVMLINIKLWKQLNITQRSIEFLIQHPSKAKYHDQDALNVILKDNWFKIDNKYNLTFQILPSNWWVKEEYYSILTQNNRSVLVKNEFEAFLEEKVIVHYNHKIKPWLLGCYHPLKYIFNDHLMKFSRSPIGAFLISSKFEYEFICLIMTAFENQDSDLETRMLFALSLHLNWLKLMNDENQRNSSFDVLNQYYKCYHLNDQELSFLNYSNEFEINKDLLRYSTPLKSDQEIS